MIYLDFLLIVSMIWPIELYLPLHIQVMSTMTASIDVTQSNQIELYDTVKYRLKFDFSKVMVEHFLNDQHDPINRMIYIEDVEQDEELFIYNETEGNEPTFIFNTSETADPDVYLYNNEEVDDLIDFIVFVPSTLVYDVAVLNANIKEYKLPGMSYIIQTY